MATEAVQIARDANDSLFTATGLAQLVSAERGLGNNDAARTALSESGDIFVSIEDQSRALQVELRLAELDIDESRFDAADTRVREVLEEALAADFPEPAIEAMKYAGDVAVLQGDKAEGVRRYEQALAHIDTTGFTSDKTTIAIKLANLFLDRGDVAAAEPHLGYVIEQEPTVEILRLRARHAHTTGGKTQSISLMEAAQDLAKESWTESDAETLARYRESQ